MQQKMRQNQLNKQETDALLECESVGRLATIDGEGYPYIVPVHFVTFEEKIYIHGLSRGEKISNLSRNRKVGFEVDEMSGLVPRGEPPCGTGTRYRSVIVKGTARMIDDEILKEKILSATVCKYTPQFAGMSFSEKMIKLTGIIEILPIEVTGKYRE